MTAPLFDDFSEPRAPGQVIGTPAPSGHARLGVDAESAVGIDNGALRIRPLVHEGWGRAALAYGPFARTPGLTFAVSLLDGHNTSQAEPLPDDLPWRLRRWLFGTHSRVDGAALASRVREWLASGRTGDLWDKLRWWVHLDPRVGRVRRLDDNLAVGFYRHAVPPDPSAAGNAFVMHALGPENGELRTRVSGQPLAAARGVQNLPLHLVVALRARGAMYFAASLPGAAGLGAFPNLRPLAIDDFAAEPEVYAGIHQSVLGQIGFRADTRVYRAQVTTVPAFASWCGPAQVADRLTGDGALEAAERGGQWRAWAGAFQRTSRGARANGSDARVVLPAAAASGLVHLGWEGGGTAGILFRARDPESYWQLTVGPAESALTVVSAGRPEPVATGAGLSGGVHTLQISDDGRIIGAFVDGRPLFPPVVDQRLAAAPGVGLVSSADGPWLREFEAHAREIAAPPELSLAPPWQARGETLIAADDFSGPAGDLAGRRTEVGDFTWERTIGAGVFELTGTGAARVRASAASPNPGRTAYTVPWQNPALADIEVDIIPPGTGRGQKEAGRCGCILWQDPDNYVTVTTYLADEYGGASMSSFFRIRGFEELYDAVWNNLGGRVTWGRSYRYRLVCDGLRYTCFVDGEPVLHRALTDVYPDMARLQIRRVGLVANWEWGDDTGSTVRAFRARG